MSFDLDYLEKLAQIVHDNDLSEIKIENEESTISLKKFQNQQTVSVPMMGASVTSQIVSPKDYTGGEMRKSSVETKQKGKPIAAPMVGTFYTSPSPNEPPFVQVGDSVSVGQIVCIIEAMKLMNEIEADVSGKITEICVKNGESVEFGQTLMYVE